MYTHTQNQKGRKEKKKGEGVRGRGGRGGEREESPGEPTSPVHFPYLHWLRKGRSSPATAPACALANKSAQVWEQDTLQGEKCEHMDFFFFRKEIKTINIIWDFRTRIWPWKEASLSIINKVNMWLRNLYLKEYVKNCKRCAWWDKTIIQLLERLRQEDSKAKPVWALWWNLVLKQKGGLGTQLSGRELA